MSGQSPKTRRLWHLTNAETSAKRASHGHTYWKHRTTGLWWSVDTAGHGGSAFKVYVEDANGDLHWYRDADQYGDFIDPSKKHKGPIGKLISFEMRHDPNR